jgi:hypothetical protein
MELNFIIANDSCNNKTNESIRYSQNQLEPNNVGNVFFDQETVLGYIAIVEISYSDIQ